MVYELANGRIERYITGGKVEYLIVRDRDAGSTYVVSYSLSKAICKYFVIEEEAVDRDNRNLKDIFMLKFNRPWFK